MLKKIYGIMEYYLHDQVWPEYDEYPINMGTATLVLETTNDGERKAYLIQSEQEITGPRVYRFDLVVPDGVETRWFVNEYTLTRQYGGPEEGGWYYDCHSPTKSTLCPDEASANQLLMEIDEKINHEAQEKEPYYNVNSPGHEYVALEHHPPMEPRQPRWS